MRGVEKRDKLRLGLTYTLLYVKQIINKDLLISIENSTQYCVRAYMGKESKKEWIYVYV